MTVDRATFMSAHETLSPPLHETTVSRESRQLLFDLLDREAEDLIYFLRQHDSAAFSVRDLADTLELPAVVVERNLAVVRQAERHSPEELPWGAVGDFPIRCTSVNGTTYYAWHGPV